ncbi:hypothetical protein NVP1253O_33 [Vibrio phage 1.253.O._10N.286.45.B12]|nr:hypothetical protein NVP1235O_33 [Vibrio phage 1.235.O._10N.261.52.B2]AUR98557.1 hypothetical protein NVP1253O_33 [Vibrio phage 1.253.O._10N.286.45.B12]
MTDKKLEIVAGAPVKLINGDDLGTTEIKTGDFGMINSVVEVDGVEYVYYMPNGVFKSFVIKADRVEVLDDEAAKAAGIIELEDEQDAEVEA